LKSVITVITISLILVTGIARAEQRYVTDELGITLRSGQDASYRVLKELKSGTSVEVLSENKETGYSRVRADDGTEGYALTRYLTNDTPAQVRAERLKAELEELRVNPDNLQDKFTKLQSDYQSLKLKYDSLEFENVQLSQRMAAIRENASNVVDLLNERDEAVQRANRLSTELEELRVRNRELENHSDKKWFMAGAGVLILGVVIGIILPRVGVRRRKSWGSDFSF
jgi:SH3 domain protein